MFKNKDGSYNKASVAITLFIIGIICAMTFSYILSNVTLPEIKFDMPTTAPQEVVQIESPIVETTLIEPVVQTQEVSQPIIFPQIDITTYLIIGAVIAVLVLMLFMRSVNMVPMIMTLIIGVVTLMVMPVILNSVMTSIPQTTSSVWSSPMASLTTSISSAMNVTGLLFIVAPVIAIIYYFSNVMRMSDYRN